MSGSDDLACDELVELVTEALDGALDPDAQARFERHLADCEGCREHVEQVRRTIALLQSVPQDERLSPEARSRLLVTFREWRRDHPPGA